MKNGKKFTKGFLPTLLVLIAILVVAVWWRQWNHLNNWAAHKSECRQSGSHLECWGRSRRYRDIDPALVQDAFSNAAIQMVFTGLVKINNDNKVETQTPQAMMLLPIK